MPVPVPKILNTSLVACQKTLKMHMLVLETGVFMDFRLRNEREALRNLNVCMCCNTIFNLFSFCWMEKNMFFIMANNECLFNEQVVKCTYG